MQQSFESIIWNYCGMWSVRMAERLVWCLSWAVRLCSSGILCAWGRAECRNWKEHVAVRDLVSWNSPSYAGRPRVNSVKSFAQSFGTSAEEVLRRALWVLWNNSLFCRVTPQIDLFLFYQRFPHPMKSCLSLSFLSLQCFYPSIPAKSNARELLVLWWWGKGKQRLRLKLPSAVLVCVGILTVTSFLFILGKADHGRSCHPEICTWRQQSHHRLMW